MKRSQLSLKWLEVFRIAARTGSVQSTAEKTGLSVSTVSHHLTKLENSLGQPLLDHTRRPMTLTPSGAMFLRRVDEALHILDKAETEVMTRNLHELQQLRFAMVEDFDSDIGPEIARMLANSLPRCAFTHFTRPSHEILDLLRNRSIDVGVASRPQFAMANTVEIPLLRDPFVLAVPAHSEISTEAFLAGESGLPFLRYSQSQIIGSMIEAQLKRLRVALPNQFEIESNQSIMALIAEGNGWAITTPTAYYRAKWLQPQVQILPFPGKGFARTLSIFVAESGAQNVAVLISEFMRNLLAVRVVDPLVEQMPWMADIYRVLPAEDPSHE